MQKSTELDRIHGQNYSDAVESVNEWMRSSVGLNQEKFNEIDTFLKSLANVAPEAKNIISVGMPWGGLREKLTGRPLVVGGACPFLEPEFNEETRPWLELLNNGTFLNTTLHLTPVNFEIDEMWIIRLKESMQKHGPTWLHYLFLGTYQLEVGDAETARASFQSSLALFPSAHAYRNLAIFAPTADEAISLYKKAWETWEKLDNSTDSAVNDLGKDLANEFSAWLLVNERWSDLSDFLAKLKHLPYLQKDRVLHARAALDIYNNEWKSAEAILTENCFPTYGSERSALIQLWWQAKQMEAVEKKGGKPLTKLETIHLRRKLGCDGDSTSTNIHSKCTRGSPNLGLEYGGF